MSCEPFVVMIPDETLHDLYERLAMTRWPDEVSGAGWDYGTNLSYLKELVMYWQDRFNWRAQEEAINRLSHFRARINSRQLHFIHEKGGGKSKIPLVLLHGWPATFTQMQKILPLLTDPVQFGGDPTDSFDVIVPSLPGFGFSDRPEKKGMSCRQAAEMIHILMTEELGYNHYALRGSDIGVPIIQHIAHAHPESVIGIHLSGATPLMGPPPADLSREEQQFLDTARMWGIAEGAYAMLQATKPQTLAYGLFDSPAGMAAWLVEKYRAWSDCNGDVETRFTKDDLLIILTIYWATGTINSSCRIYYETMRDIPQFASRRIEIPTGMAQFPGDLVPACRAWEERFWDLRHWALMPAGGHFAEHEEPQLLAEDIREFFRPPRELMT